MPAISKKIKRIITWFVIYAVMSAVITIFIMSLIPKMTNDHISSFPVFIETAILTFSIAILCTPAGYCAIHFLQGKSYLIKIPAVVFAVLCATAAGNAVGCYFVEVLRKDTRHWLVFNDLGFNLLLASGIAILTVIIEDLIKEKDELVKDFNEIKNSIDSESENRTISIKDVNGYHAIKFSELIYLSSHGKKTTFNATEQTYTVNQLLKDIEDKLPSDIFLRVHKQYIINIKYLKQIRYYEGGRYTAYLDDEDESIIPVGRSVAPVLKEKFNI
jgi:hypothetical protein